MPGEIPELIGCFALVKIVDQAAGGLTQVIGASLALAAPDSLSLAAVQMLV